MTEPVQYPHLMRLDEFYACDPRADSLGYMSDAVIHTHDVLSAAEAMVEGRKDKEQMLEGIEAVRDRLEQLHIRMHSKADPADYAVAGFMLSGAVYELVRRHCLEDAVSDYQKRKRLNAKGGRQSGKTKRQTARVQDAPVREQISCYLKEKPEASTSEIRRYLAAHAGRLGIVRDKLPKKTKFHELVAQERRRQK